MKDDKTESIDTFDLLERVIITALVDAEDRIGEDADLRVLMAVLAKLVADAALDYGLDEEQFVSSMRGTFQAVEAAKAHFDGEMQ